MIFLVKERIGEFYNDVGVVIAEDISGAARKLGVGIDGTLSTEGGRTAGFVRSGIRADAYYIIVEQRELADLEAIDDRARRAKIVFINSSRK